MIYILEWNDTKQFGFGTKQNLVLHFCHLIVVNPVVQYLHRLWSSKWHQWVLEQEEREFCYPHFPDRVFLVFCLFPFLPKMKLSHWCPNKELALSTPPMWYGQYICFLLFAFGILSLQVKFRNKYYPEAHTYYQPI